MPSLLLIRKKHKKPASITTNSDGEVEQTSNFTGWGLVQGIETTGNSTTVCVGAQSKMTITVSNTGGTDLLVDSVVFNNGSKEFQWEDASKTKDFWLSPGIPRDLVILFNSNTAKTVVDSVIVYNESLKHNRVGNEISGTALHFQRSSIIVDPTPPANNSPIPIDRKVTRQIFLETGSDITAAQVKSLNITINYDGDFLRVLQSDIKLGADLSGGKYSISNLKIDDKAGSITLTIDCSDIIVLKDKSELLNFSIGTFLPKKDKRTSNITYTIEAINSGVKTPCVDITANISSITIDSTCVYNIRKVFATATDYALAQVNPNPVGSNGANIEFAVGLDGMTEIVIYDSKGEVVARPVSEVLSVGKYTVNVPVGNLSSGTYYYKIKSGPYEETRNMIVVK